MAVVRLVRPETLPETSKASTPSVYPAPQERLENTYDVPVADPTLAPLT